MSAFYFLNLFINTSRAKRWCEVLQQNGYRKSMSVNLFDFFVCNSIAFEVIKNTNKLKWVEWWMNFQTFYKFKNKLYTIINIILFNLLRHNILIQWLVNKSKSV